MVGIFQSMSERRGHIRAESGLVNISERVERAYENIMGGNLMSSGREVERTFGHVPVTHAAQEELGKKYLMKTMLEKRKALTEKRLEQPVVLTDEEVKLEVSKAIQKLRPRSLRS